MPLNEDCKQTIQASNILVGLGKMTAKNMFAFLEERDSVSITLENTIPGMSIKIVSI